MDVSIRHNPAFAVARAQLAANESLKAESGAMMAHSTGVTVEAKMEGGLVKSLKRSVLGGESLFITRFNAGADGGWIDCAARLPGDVAMIDVADVYNLVRGAWLCSSDALELDTKWGGFKNLAGGEGGFLVRITGTGRVVCSCYGALDKITLGAGESVVLDSGHLVGFTEGTQYITRKVTSGMMQTLKSGEGLVFEFTGPGEILTQTRNPHEYIAWLTAELPFSRE